MQVDALGFELPFGEGHWKQEKEHIDPNGYSYIPFTTIDGHDLPVLVYTDGCGVDSEISEAIADLIEQSPSLYHALAKLVHLHGCEQEGLSSGKPTPQQWMDAINEASAALAKARGKKQ
jgi:hypothetical protein